MPGGELNAIYQDAMRYRKLKALGACDSKTFKGFSPGSREKAKASFRFWCKPEELDKLVDEA